MEGKNEGGSFLKQLQNKLKNLKRKLEKIETKEKRPTAELTEEEKELVRNKPILDSLSQEYERIIANYLSSKEAPAAPVEVPPEIRVETHFVDQSLEVAQLWLALHYIVLPGVKEAYLAQGQNLDDFQEALVLREKALGTPGTEVKDLLTVAVDLFRRYLKPESPKEQQSKEALTRVKQWSLSQKVPETAVVLTVDTPREQHEILKQKQEQPKPIEEHVPEPEIVEAPQQEPEPVVEEAKELTSKWAEEVDEEVPVEEVKAVLSNPTTSEEPEFTEVKGKPKRKKEAPTVQSEPRGDRGGRRRGWRGGERRPPRTWRGPPKPQETAQ